VNKTNDRLYKGIDNAKVTMDVTVKQIHQAQNKVTEISDSIFEHEQEIKKNQALIDKLVKFTGGNE
jgi:hypothetical protein